MQKEQRRDGEIGSVLRPHGCDTPHGKQRGGPDDHDYCDEKRIQRSPELRDT
jgi:hypothetical protein